MSSDYSTIQSSLEMVTMRMQKGKTFRTKIGSFSVQGRKGESVFPGRGLKEKYRYNIKGTMHEFKPIYTNC